MILRIFDRFFAWLKGARAVRCDAGREGTAADPEDLGGQLRKRMDQMTRDAFLSSFGITMPSQPAALDQQGVDNIYQALIAMEEKHQERIDLIVVTSLDVFGACALKCKYRQKWYLLIGTAHWQQLKASIPQRSPDDSPLPFSPFSLAGIPWVEDDELAARIIRNIVETKIWRSKFSVN